MSFYFLHSYFIFPYSFFAIALIVSAIQLPVPIICTSTVVTHHLPNNILWNSSLGISSSLLNHKSLDVPASQENKLCPPLLFMIIEGIPIGYYVRRVADCLVHKYRVRFVRTHGWDTMEGCQVGIIELVHVERQLLWIR